jgi:hypothetical protein
VRRWADRRPRRDRLETQRGRVRNGWRREQSDERGVVGHRCGGRSGERAHITPRWGAHISARGWRFLSSTSSTTIRSRRARKLAAALPMAHRIRELKRRAHRARVSVIYVNDNFGRARSDFRALVARCLRIGAGASGGYASRPSSQDNFVFEAETVRLLRDAARVAPRASRRACSDPHGPPRRLLHPPHGARRSPPQLHDHRSA